MSIRLVEMNVTPELRKKIKAIKKEKTYDQFLSELLEKKERIPKTPLKENNLL